MSKIQNPDARPQVVIHKDDTNITDDSNIVASEKYEYPKHDTTDGRGRTEAAQTQRTPSPGHRIGCVEKTAYDEEQSFPSMRSRRLARMQGEVGSDDKPKGVVRYAQDMTLEVWLSDRKQQNGTWIPAVYHNDLRSELIAEWNQKGSYEHPRASGVSAADITCFLPQHKSWGGERQNRPKILFQLYRHKPTEKQPDISEPKRSEKARSTKSLSLNEHGEAPVWYHRDRIVLDGDNHPVKKYTEIPATCSSEIEGWLMVAIRRTNSHITTQDIRARMPHFRTFKSNGAGDKPQWSLQAHTMRQTRFTLKSASLSWEKRAGSDRFHDYLLSILPPGCKQQNSTETFRDLHENEIHNMQALNRGKHMYRGRKRKGDDNREIPEPCKKQKTEKSEENRRNITREQNIKMSNKRQRDSMVEEDLSREQLVEQAPKKRRISRQSTLPRTSSAAEPDARPVYQASHLEQQYVAGQIHSENRSKTYTDDVTHREYQDMLTPALPQYMASTSSQGQFQQDAGLEVGSLYTDFNGMLPDTIPTENHKQTYTADNEALRSNEGVAYTNNLDPRLSATVTQAFGASAGPEWDPFAMYPTPPQQLNMDDSHIPNPAVARFETMDNGMSNPTGAVGSVQTPYYQQPSYTNTPPFPAQIFDENFQSILAGREDLIASQPFPEFMSRPDDPTMLPTTSVNDVEVHHKLPPDRQDGFDILEHVFGI